MNTRKPVRCRHGAGDTWTSRSMCAWTKRVGGDDNSWGRHAVRGCHVG
jgi:hypothetical protein